MEIDEITKEFEKRLPTEKELEKLRDLLDQDSRIKWFWSTARTWLLFLSASVAFFTVGFDGIRSILRKLVS